MLGSLKLREVITMKNIINSLSGKAISLSELIIFSVEYKKSLCFELHCFAFGHGSLIGPFDFQNLFYSFVFGRESRFFKL